MSESLISCRPPTTTTSSRNTAVEETFEKLVSSYLVSYLHSRPPPQLGRRHSLHQVHLLGFQAHVLERSYAQVLICYFRDLKPENIVIDGEQLKLIDFGFAKAMASSRQMTNTVIGTPLYMSPQLLSKQPYTSKCDIWSIGILFYEMLFGHHPWTANGMFDLYTKIN